MKLDDAAARLEALGNPTRLTIYRALVRAGDNGLSVGTLQGKLIRATRRGRLLGMGGVIGSAGAVCAAYFLLRPWIQLPNHDGFVYIFLFNGSAYVIAGLMANLCFELPDNPSENPTDRPPWWTPFLRAWQTFLDDRRFPPGCSPGLIVCSAPDERALMRMIRYADRAIFRASNALQPLRGQKRSLTLDVLAADATCPAPRHT